MYFLLSLVGEEPDFSQIDPAEMQRTMDEMAAYNESLEKAGAWVTGGGLQQRDQSKTVRFSSEDSTVTDGPFAETKEQLAGFWIIKAESVEAAVDWARRAPLQEGAIEVRPFAHDLADDAEVSAEELLDGVQGKGEV